MTQDVLSLIIRTLSEYAAVLNMNIEAAMTPSERTFWETRLAKARDLMRRMIEEFDRGEAERKP